MITVIYVKGSERYPDRRKQAGVADFARGHGWNLQTVGAIDTAEQLKTILELWSPAGFIVNRAAGLNRLPAAAYGRRPVLFFEFPSSPKAGAFNCVYNDARQTAALVARELLRLDLVGYAYVNWRKPVFWNECRRKAFFEILSLHERRGRAYVPATDDPATEVRALADWLKGLPRPLGVFAANDTIAQEVSAACTLAGLSVPDDVSIVGVDNDTEVCEGNTPTLSSVELDHFRSGQLAAETLERMMKRGLTKAESVVYPTLGLVRRESSRRLTFVDKAVSSAVERIRREACTGLSAADVVKGFSCSRRVAEIRFRKATGRSVLEEIRSVRLQRATELLKNGALDIGYIAHQTGYSTLPAFSAFFKAETGLSPAAWRKRNVRAHSAP